jgi:hypothetical protein
MLSAGGDARLRMPVALRWSRPSNALRASDLGRDELHPQFAAYGQTNSRTGSVAQAADDDNGQRLLGSGPAAV